MSNFEIGETYFTKQGEKVCLDAITQDGKFVVSQIMQYVNYHDDFYEDVGPSKVVDKIFSQAPVAILDERFKEAQARLDAINAEHDKRFAEITTAERDIKNRLAKLKKYQGLELLEDFIDGTITHVVYANGENSTDLTVKPLSRVLEKGSSSGYNDRDLRLLSLFGRSNGDLTWKVNQYYDGSGYSSGTIFPCRSEEDGQEVIRRIHQQRVDEQFAHLDPARPYWFLTYYEKALSVGLEQRPEVTAKYQELKRVNLQEAEKKARDALAKAQKTLDDIIASREAQP